MVLTSFIIILIYLFLIGSFTIGFDRVKDFTLKSRSSKTTFSVIIPFRNEAEHLSELLASILKLEYPKHLYDVIFVDDASNDDSVSIIEKTCKTLKSSGSDTLNIHIIENNRQTNSPKKDAITTAVKHAKNDWIITTDADCVLPKFWLDSFDEYIQENNATCIVAPVTYYNVNTSFKRFQLLDILSLQGATIGGFGINKPIMCNGANFAYEKALFNALKGFDGNSNIASGDDIFFLEKVSRNHPKQLHYLKSEHAIVTTTTETSWRHVIEQRVRWASKASHYKNWFSKFTGLVVLLTNTLIITLILLTLLGEFHPKSLVYVLVIKFSIDFLLLFKTASFFNQKEALLSYPWVFILYPFFSVYIAFLSLFKTYKWKDRTFRK
ncbi:glycosyltransferase family 2 protein [Seonamhaeicola marinus]|uniref:Glycosyltransferase n=1 Tax=Seonamhaeicola marinus TaxID=1912246 RepID=A0A5D0HKY4_9FLAO|nr:glycosyltransferase [Seonamhaeicola marinus]TYA69962.1 glycosyltransferase [Seonamhaeicola marinus]